MKTKFLILILSIFAITVFIQSIYSQAGWNSVNSPQSGFHLYGIYFTDINTGNIDQFKTTNGGLNWIQTNFFDGYAMCFSTPSVGYKASTGISKTTNGGDNWVSQSNPGDLIWGIHFPNSNSGYGCGSSASIIKTTNGGTNWVVLASPVSTSYFLKGVYFTDANTGYICGYTTSGFPSVILKTTNGGTNWSVQNFPSGTGYYSIFFVNASTGIVIGEKAAKTTDAGNSWVEKSQDVTTFQHSLFFPSANTGYSTGFGGNIIKTTDGGETWFQQTTGTGSDLESVYFLNDNTGFVCGDNGKVLKTTDGGGPPIGITPISGELPEKFSLSQNYPNPFNPVTNISFSIPQRAYVKIIIYDAAGKAVDAIVNFELNAGTYKVDWQAANFPSGLYFYSLQAGNYKESKKMILIK